MRGVPERYLRSQQDKAAAAAAAAAASVQNGTGDSVDAGAPAAPVDEGLSAFDLADPVEILSKLPKDFYEKLVRRRVF